MTRRWSYSLKGLAMMAIAGTLLMTACAQVKAEDIKGLLQAMQGKEMVVTLADGTTARITVQDAQAAAAAQQLVGKEVDVKIRVEGNERRMEDVKRLGEDQKFTGVIQSMGSDNWTVGGRVFKVNANTKLDGGLAVGVTARVEFVAQADGAQLATSIETDEEDEKFKGTVQSIGSDNWTIGGQSFKVNAATRIDPGLAVGAPVRVKFVIQANGSFLAIKIESDQPQNHFAGVIQSIGTDNWTVSGKVFKVNAATKRDDGLAVGVKARVEFITLADGSSLATEIQTDEAEDRFSGTAGNITATTWVVSGKTFKVTATTRIDPGLVVGSKVKVRFTTLADGTMLATRIQEDKRGPGVNKDEFSGTADNITATAWVIGGKTFKITTATRIDKGLTVGTKVRVRFTTLTDGSMLAIQIQADRSDREGDKGDQRGQEGDRGRGR